MDKAAATLVFETLSSGIRLDVFRLLVRHAPTGLVAGEISTALELPPANLSFHLKGMTQAGLIGVEQEGRFLRYRANLELMQALVDYLTEECCSANAGCGPCGPSKARKRAPGKQSRRKVSA